MHRNYKESGPDFIRKGNTVRNLMTGKTTEFEFINEAKRHSRKIQMDAHGLGCGVLVVR